MAEVLNKYKTATYDVSLESTDVDSAVLAQGVGISALSLQPKSCSDPSMAAFDLDAVDNHTLSKPTSPSAAAAAALRHEALVAELRWRMREGGGEVLWEVAPSDEDPPASTTDAFAAVAAAAAALSATATVIRRAAAPGGRAAACAAAGEVLVRREAGDGGGDGPVDVRVAVVGNVDSGKSTLVGVLTSGRLDNGRGLARSRVFRHRHETDSGRTSSASHQIMGLDAAGRLVGGGARETDWGAVVAASAKVLTLIDLAGHEKYVRTTVSGMTGCVPDYALVAVGANMGVLRMTKEHLAIAVALRLPLVFAVTKVDMCPPHVLKQTLADIAKILKSPGVGKLPVVVRGEGDVILAAKSMANDGRVAPIFLLSCVTGEGLDLLRLFLNLAPPRQAADSEPEAAAAFHIDDTYHVPGVGTVVGGTMLRGSLSLRDSVLIGPDGRGLFVPVQLKSIMNKRVPVARVAPGQSATFALKKLKKNQLRKGMVITGAALQPKACLRYVAEVLILHHPTTIGPNYQPVVHCLTIRQASKIVGADRNEVLLRSGDRARVTFEFLYRPEYLVLGARLIFREGGTKGIGKVVGLHYTDGTHASLDEPAR